MISLYSENEKRKKPPSSVIKFEGIYFFGGMRQNGDLIQKLYILMIGQNPMKWMSPQAIIDMNGPSPPGMIGHSMMYNPILNILTVFGGRNDQYSPINSECFFNSVWMLKLGTLQWVKLSAEGLPPSVRYGHASCAVDSKIFVFGGLNGREYS